MSWNEVSRLLNAPPAPAWGARQVIKNLKGDVEIAGAKISHWERIVAERGEVDWLAVKYTSLQALKATLAQAEANLAHHLSVNPIN